MKTIILVISLFALSSKTTFAQCNKKLVLTSSQTEYLDANGIVQRTEEEQTVIEVSKSNIIITPGNEQHKMTGTIQSDTCKWTVPYKEGKTVINAKFLNERGEAGNATITIEGKNGKIALLMKIAEMPDRIIRVIITTFKEKE